MAIISGMANSLLIALINHAAETSINDDLQTQLFFIYIIDVIFNITTYINESARRKMKIIKFFSIFTNISPKIFYQEICFYRPVPYYQQ
jgi:hypothetical protein